VRLKDQTMDAIYDLYQAQCDLLAPLQLTAKFMAAAWAPFTNIPFNLVALHSHATCEMIARSGLLHVRPAFCIDSVKVGNTTVAVHEETVLRSPFATLIHFRKDVAERGPVVIVVAALSGHFATLTRGTVQTLLQDHDVYITDWHSARDMPVSAGKFGLDEYIDHVIEYLEYLGPDTNVVAVCQSGPPVLAAISLMAQRHSPNQPRSMTLMASPIDPRISPNKINKMAESKTIEFFQQMIQTVPSRFKGGGRKVYPGFIQLTAFMFMNIDNHINKHVDLYNAMVDKDEKKVHTITEFYDEYRSVLDSTAEFYLETIQRIFLDHDLPRGRFYHHGKLVTPSAIRNTYTLVIEGENDDMCGIGQTSAAFDLCTSLRPDQKQYHMQHGVGHYGVFNGSRWNSGIYPVIKAMIATNDARIAAELAEWPILKIAA
jgi:poly(3-hydroxybutyrate) depolymerase